MNKITQQTINRLPVQTKRYTFKLGESLFVRVFPSGVKTYVLRYSKHGKVRDITLGRVPMTIAQAKAQAHKIRARLGLKSSEGARLWDAFYLWRDKKKSLTSYPNEKKRIEKYIITKLGKCELDSLNAPQILEALENLKDRPATRRRCLMRINEMLNLAKAAGLVDANVASQLSRILPPKCVRHHPYINPQNLNLLFSLCSQEKRVWQIYVTFCVWSMLRPNEVSQMQWSWITDDVMIIPARFMKKRRDHTVPLIKPVINLLDEIRYLNHSRSPYIWRIGRGRHVHVQALTKWLKASDLSGVTTHHGLRATGRTWMAEQGVAFEVAESMLAHVTGSETVQAYMHSQLTAQRRIVLQNWWDYLVTQGCAQCAVDSRTNN